jgi:hypothetical protein
MQRPTLVSSQPGYGLSGSLWDNFPVDEILAMQDHNYGYGFIDEFNPYNSGNYGVLASGSGTTFAQIAETLQGEAGIIKATMAATADHEAVIQRGNALCCPFVLNNFDLCFEARLRFSAITAAKWAWFLGLAQPSALTTSQLFTTHASSPPFYSAGDFVGFSRMGAITTGAVSGMYQNGSGTYMLGATATTGAAQNLVDGTLNTNLAALGTVVASAGSVTNPVTVNTYVPSWINLGFRYQASLGFLRWYVNGVEVTKARLVRGVTQNTTPYGLTYTFPNATLLAPTFGVRNVASGGTPAALGVWMEWWACAQASPSYTLTGPDTAPP